MALIKGAGMPSGPDPKATETLERIKKMVGTTCPALECAMKHKVDHCLKCAEFPCQIHYQGFPYSKIALDLFKQYKLSK